MNGLRTLALVSLIVGVLAWFALPMYTMSALGVVEMDVTAREVLISQFNETETWSERLHSFPFLVAAFSILAFGFGLLEVWQKDYGTLMGSSICGGAFMLFFMPVSRNEGSQLIEAGCGFGYIVMLIAFAVTFFAAIPLYRENKNVQQSPTARGTKPFFNSDKNKSTNHSVAPKNNAANTSDIPDITCCQCGKTAKRTEFYTIGSYGNANLGVCHKCYEKIH